jgi:hypothetical protein
MTGPYFAFARHSVVAAAALAGWMADQPGRQFVVRVEELDA